MNFYIVIPAHNEEAYIARTLKSLIRQSLLPKKIVVVNDNSSDSTASIVDDFTRQFDFVSMVNLKSSDVHLPGSKIIKAFQAGIDQLDTNYDVICKFDADLIFPTNYLERIAFLFNNDQTIGMASGFCYIEKDNEWVLENLTQKDHIRGALKAYKKECFKHIGGLKHSIGWDTVDELLAKYHGWSLHTDKSLRVKHLKPTGSRYNKQSQHLQGEAMYKMRYGFWISFLSALKMAYKRKSLRVLVHTLKGYLISKQQGLPYIVNAAEGEFIRKYRWKHIRKKLF